MTDVENSAIAASVGRDSHRVRSTVFVSYSHADKDTDWFTAVIQYLKQLNTGGEIEVWEDSKIRPGDNWREEIEEKLRVSVAAVFLVSPTFITSEFIGSNEVEELLDRCETDGIAVHALLAKPSDWEDHPIAKFMDQRQLANSPDEPLEAMDGPDRNKCLDRLVRLLRKQIGTHRHRYSKQRRDSLMQEIEDLSGVELLEEVAGGDTSIIYRGRDGTRDLAVKALISRNVSDDGERQLMSEVEKCRGLNHPSFVKISNAVFERGKGVFVADWVNGQPLKQFIARTRRIHDKRRWWERVAYITRQLAAAVAEAHRRGLRFVNLDPSNIFLAAHEPRLYPIDFSTWIAATEHADGALSVTLERLEYLAPEILNRRIDGHEHAQCDEREEAEQQFAHKNHQYTLGVLALSLLDGSPPVSVRAIRDIETLIAFHADPRGFYEECTASSDELGWSRALPGLARVIWRMLEPDPANRWESMDDVTGQLQAVIRGCSDITAHVTEAKEFYSEEIRGNDAFYVGFYDAFLRDAEDVRPHFEGVDMPRQRQLLDGAIERLLNFRPNQAEPTTLTQIAASHVRFDLSPRHFEQFGQAFLGALDAVLQIDSVTRDSWEAILWPGMEYMKSNATRPPSGRPDAVVTPPPRAPLSKAAPNAGSQPSPGRGLPDRYPDGCYSTRGAQQRLGVSQDVLRRWIREGRIEAERKDYGHHRNVYWLRIDEETAEKLGKGTRGSRRRASDATSA